MEKLTENAIEQFSLRLLKRLGYSCLYGPDIAPDGKMPLRASYESPILAEKLQAVVDRLNPAMPAQARREAVRQVMRLSAPDLLSNNEAFHLMLTQGVNVSYQKDGAERGDLVRLVDFDDPENNDFLAVNQFTVVENNANKRPDVVLFVNGLPLVIMELKNAADKKATIKTAYKQLQTYKAVIPCLMAYNALLVVSDGLEAKAGSLTADFFRFMAWKSEDGETEASPLKGQMEILINGLLNKATLLDIIRFFTVFEKSKTEDANGLTTVTTAKKIAAYHQYYAVNKAVQSTIRAAMLEDDGKGKGGVIWHTQGSGKSLSMVFFTGKIVVSMDNPTVVVLTDRNDLDDQLFETFSGASKLLRQEPKQADNREDLKKLLMTASGGIVFSTMQKFQPGEGRVYDLLSDRRNIVVIADEAHRSQYGFKAREIDEKDASGKVVGKKTVFGFAKYLRDALPNAVYIGFTGTPIEATDINTPAVFGEYIDIYDIARAVEDGATVPIFYESRLAKIDLPEEGRRLIKELDEELESGDYSDTEKAKAKRARLEALVGSEPRLRNIAADIVAHFEAREKVFAGKALVVCMSRNIAADLYKEIAILRPQWANTDLSKGKIKVVMTASSDDGPKLAQFQTNKQQRRALAERMKNPDDELHMAIVCDMWLTGFDVPCLHTMYLDKPLKGHTLIQAIARVNRVYGDKPGGLVVDYLGIAADLKKALGQYGATGGKGEPETPPVNTQEQAVGIMREKLEVTRALLHDFAYLEYLRADTSRKLAIILETEEFILGLDDGKKRFLDAVTALSAAFALAMPHSEAVAVTEEVAFFQAVKARLAKFGGNGGGGGRSTEDMESAIKQVIDQALVSEKVIDVFDAAGIKKPDISILSEDFMLEMRAMPHKNIALEVLRKLLNDELTARSRTNLVQSRALLEMLEEALKRYHNKVITAAQVIEEMISIARQVTTADKEAQEMDLTPYEYAFYTAVADNESARELMQKEKLRELAVVLTDKVRANTGIDWNIKESVRAELRVIIKRTLRQYGYPPDMQQLATETVMKQAEMLAEELVTE
jgi:type I restriction enzyme R subunit